MESIFNTLGSTLLKVMPVIAVVVIVPMVLASLNKNQLRPGGKFKMDWCGSSMGNTSKYSLLSAL